MTTNTGPSSLRPFRPAVTDQVVEDLRRRIAATRLPAPTPGPPWRSGVPVDWLRDVLEHWRTGFDWRAFERDLDRVPHVLMELSHGVLHAVHVRSDVPDAIPIVLVHGWPGSFVEMLELAGMLADPAAHGAHRADAFHVVVPSLPGFGYSSPPPQGWGVMQSAEAIDRLMRELAYTRYAIHAYDIGASAMTGLLVGDAAAASIIGYHTTEPGIPGPHPRPPLRLLAAGERVHRRFGRAWEADEGGYFAILGSRPDTIGAALTDSPAGLAAWILEKWRAWTVPPASGADLFDLIPRERVLANLSVYWLTGTVNSANRTYFQGLGRARVPGEQARVPVGVALTTQPIERAPRTLAERFFPDIRWWTELGAGGHFVTVERPALLAASIRAFVRPLRAQDRQGGNG